MRRIYRKYYFLLLILISLGGSGNAQKYPILKGYESSFFPKLFKTLNEPAIGKTNRSALTIRLTLFRSFDPLIVVRLESYKNHGILIFKKINGKRPPELSRNRIIVMSGANSNGSPNYIKAKVAVQKRKVLSETEFNHFYTNLLNLGFYKKPNENIGFGMMDGSVWLLEVKQKERYHFYAFRPSRDEQTKNVCISFLNLTEFEIENLY